MPTPVAPTENTRTRGTSMRRRKANSRVAVMGRLHACQRLDPRKFRSQAVRGISHPDREARVSTQPDLHRDVIGDDTSQSPPSHQQRE